MNNNITLGKEINIKFKSVIVYNIHHPTRELTFNSMLDALRSPIRLIITNTVFNSIPNPIEDIRL